MKTYTLTTGALHRAGCDDGDRFCALGIFLSEKGHSVQEIDEKEYALLDHSKYGPDLMKMIDALGIDRPDEFDSFYAPVYRANDGRKWDVEERRFSGYKFSADQIKAALKAAGIEVELNDMRGK